VSASTVAESGSDARGVGAVAEHGREGTLGDHVPVVDARSPFADLLLRKTPLGALVRGVAAWPASVHRKLLVSFLVVTVLFIAMGVVSLRTISAMSGQAHALDSAHERVHWSQEMEHALAMQMHFTALALVARDDATIARILRENNRFNDTLARIERAAPDDERLLIQRIRTQQEEAMSIIADIANLIRDRRFDAALDALRTREEPLYREIERLVRQVVDVENRRMAALRDDVNAANRRSAVTMTGFAVATVLLALLCGFVTSWAFILPVRQTSHFVDEVAAGRFGGVMHVANRDEFGVLAARTNAMSRELARLDREQKEAAAALRGSNDRLQQASRAKSEFLANMSHELRTPLNAILGFAEMIQDGLYGDVPDEFREPIADIQTNGRHLLRLINDVLDLSKIEAGRMELAVDEYSPHEIVDTVRTSLRSLAADKGLAFTADVPDQLLLARGDGKRLMQCLMNLAGNALKFTHEGHVEIGVRVEGDHLVYRVSDSGIGIPAEQLAQVFAEFRQVDATITREFGGTGLGLSITKKFVELHGGRIWVESELGRGSTFFFSVPQHVEETPRR